MVTLISTDNYLFFSFSYIGQNSTDVTEPETQGGTSASASVRTSNFDSIQGEQCTIESNFGTELSRWEEPAENGMHFLTFREKMDQEHQQRGAISQGGSHFCTYGNINVVIKKGNITKQWCDVMVITGSKDLKLKNRKLSKLVLDAAGLDIQTACDTKYPSGVNYREVAFTRAYKLHCRFVYFGCLPDWKDTSDNPQQVLTDFITKCLDVAHSQDVNHIAFPTLGTGAQNTPHHVMARTMKTCIGNFNRKHKYHNTRSNLQHVTIVIFDKSKDCRVMENVSVIT
ncbi:unnamed protein product [Mytilus edulis]|uniref:Macro domain-containing protein n=1 Tax=Mytilus edulis TaxID=6550 RepID=A0A8S3RLU9_MYTED|nr:unnamed protein product [Mytilus edulis]